MGDTVFCTSLAGDEIGRVRTVGHPPAPARPTTRWPARRSNCDMPADAAASRSSSGTPRRAGSRIRFDTEYLSLVQDADGVHRDGARPRRPAQTYEIRAKYLIGADGGRSQVAEDVGLPMEGADGPRGHR